MPHTFRGEITSFLATVDVTFQTQVSPHVRCLLSSIHMRACEIAGQGSFAQSSCISVAIVCTNLAPLSRPAEELGQGAGLVVRVGVEGFDGLAG